MSTHADIVIVGGGIVGMATAHALVSAPNVLPRYRVLVVEAEERLGAHQTGHNSGVIHSGIYYRPGSLKAQTCAAGRERLYRFCADNGIPHERCGKLIVAVAEDECAKLEELARRGEQNGLQGIRRLKSSEIRDYEPFVKALAGLWIPQTGIVDYRRVLETLAQRVRSVGAEVRLGARMIGLRKDRTQLVVETTQGEIRAGGLINCAGLQSDRIARMCGVNPDVRIVPFRGQYYHIRAEKAHIIRHLVYPVPDPRFPFLGVHFTRTVTGEREAGPNAVLAFKREGYTRASFSWRDTWETFTWPGALRLFSKHWKMGLAEFQRSYSKRAFLRALQRMAPSLELDDLTPGNAGVRAQAVARDGTLVDDFKIERAERMIHVLNAPSPAATASLEIGAQISAMVREHFKNWLG
jgi:L-2-hydroxyglutarate oxidase